MKKKNSGFTLVELIAVITILSLILILIVPSVSKTGETSKDSLRKTKINTLITAAEQYGNEKINDYQQCQGSLNKEELKEKCAISMKELILNGYMKSETDENEIIDPKTNKAFPGKMLLCFNPAKVNVYASYADKDEDYSCKDISIDSDSFLNLSSVGGVGYVNGDDIEVTIIKSGEFTSNPECDTDDHDIATCRVVDNKMIITPTKIPFEDENPKNVAATLSINYSGGTLSKKYSLEVRPTRLLVTNSGDKCMEVSTTREIELDKLNTGTMSVTSNKPDILEGIVKDDKLSIASKTNIGNATLTLQEKNGNNKVEIEKDIYRLKMDRLPDGMLFGKVDDIAIDIEGTGEITITSDHPEVIQLSLTNSTSGSPSIKISEGTTKYYIIAKTMGTATVTVEGAKCGNITGTINVSNLGLEETSGTLYLGGKSVSVAIDAEDTSKLKTSSSNTSVATADIVDGNLIVSPGIIAGDAFIRVTNEANASVSYYVNVLDTNLEIVDEDGNKVTNVCTEKSSGINDKNVVARGLNIGTVTAEPEDPKLASTIVTDDGPQSKIEITSVYQDVESGPYKIGYNTGRTKINVKESNGNKTASFYYDTYTLSISDTHGEVTIEDSITFDVTFSGTGSVSVGSSDENIATAEILPVYTYDGRVNVTTTKTVKVTGISEGTATITVKGEYCGVRTYEVNVTGKKITVKFEPGPYATSVSESELSCTTEGADRSCKITLPDITPKEGFRVIGFNKDKDSLTGLGKANEEFSINISDDNSIFYGITMDTSRPTCSMAADATIFKTKIGAVIEAELVCMDTGTGIRDKELTPEDFYSDKPELGFVKEVSEPIERPGGYSYNVRIESKDIGEYNIILNAETIKDKHNNYNDYAITANIYSGEYTVVEFANIGRVNPDDVIAIVYDNAEITGNESDAGTYSLELYGAGEMMDFETPEFPYLPIWHAEYEKLITNLTIEDGITNIGDELMWGAKMLKSVTIPDGVTYIGKSAFESTNIQEVTIPSSVTEIRDQAFYENKELSRITLGENVETIGVKAFSMNKVENIYIPSSVTKIDDFAFYGDLEDLKLKSITFGENSNLKTIGEYAFENNLITSLTIPASVESIGTSAFGQSMLLTDLTFEEGSVLKEIGPLAFTNTQIKSLDLPESVEKIDFYAFNSLTDTIETFKIGKNVKELGIGFAMGRALKAFEVDPLNEFFLADSDGILYSKDMTKLIKCPDVYYKNHSQLHVPESVVEIMNSAFEGYYFIGERGFDLYIPANVQFDPEYNFVPFNLNTINIDENENYVSIDGIVYSKDMKTLYKIPDSYEAEEYTVPAGVQNVGTRCGYMNWGIKKIILPESVSVLNDESFYSDPDYSFKEIYLYTDAITQITTSTFRIANYTEPPEGSPPKSRIIYVSNSFVRGLIEKSNIFLDNFDFRPIPEPPSSSSSSEESEESGS